MKSILTPALVYRVPRAISIFISYLVFAFLIELIREDAFISVLVGVVVGVAATAGIIYIQRKKKQSQLFTLLPLGLWIGLLFTFFARGFDPTIDFVQFIFLSVLAGLLTVLSYYAWTYTQIGGLTYIGIGMFYFFLAVNRVPMLSLFFTVGLFVITGVSYYYQEYLQWMVESNLQKKSLVPQEQIRQQGDDPQ